MVRSGRNVNDELKCTTKSCYIHPKLTFPVEAFTPLHSQVRQHQDGDYTNFLRICYLIGIKTPMDSMEHLLEGVTVKRMTAWAQDIRLALATCIWILLHLSFLQAFLSLTHALPQSNAKHLRVRSNMPNKSVTKWKEKLTSF